MKLRILQTFSDRMNLSRIHKHILRNSFWIFLVILFFVLGIWTGSAIASEPETKKVARQLSVATVLTTTTTSSTTTTTAVPATTIPVTVPPTTQPEPVIPQYDVGSVQQMIVEASIKYGLDPDRMLRIAKCESGFNPASVNRNYFAGGGNPSGVFQYLPDTWKRMSNNAGFGGADVFDAYANVNVAAHAFSTGRSGEWACK